jgi:hypothetical protein
MSKVRNSVIIILLICINTAIKSQNISGIVKSTSHELIDGASIILKDQKHTIISYTYTNESGAYSLTTNKTGDFTLYVNTMGYEQQSVEVSITNNSEKRNIDLILNPKINELSEVVLETKRSIVIKKDTIIFNANSFITGNEEVVEDLLKKLPGLNITADGTIKIGNQEVEKVMIDGDDMFEKGYKILTKNMPITPIEKVEVYQNYSNNKHLKGIENSEKVALNLTLKEDFKRKWFGNLSLGSNMIVENRYFVRSNFMNFGKKSKYYFLTNLNNIGFDAIGDINHLIRPYLYDEIESIGDDQSTFTILDIGSDLPNLKSKRFNFNNAEMLSLNSILTLSEKVKLKLLGFFNTDENDFFKKNFQSFLLGNDSFSNTENFVGRKTQMTGFGKVDLNYEVSKTKSLEYTLKLNKSNENNRSNLQFNDDLLNENLSSNNQFFNHKLVFSNRFKTNKVFILTGSFINEKTPQNYKVNQFIYEDLFTENANNTKQFSQNQLQFVGIEAHLLEKGKRGDLLEVMIGNKFRIDNLVTRFELLYDDNSLSFPTNYQNSLTYSTHDLYLSVKYHYKFGNYTLLTQSDFHQLINKADKFDILNQQNPFFINPKIGLNWKINDKNKLLATYSFNTSNAGVLDVYSGFVQTGFSSFSKGIDEFSQINSSSAFLNYTYGSWGDKFFANTFIMYTKNKEYFSEYATITQNYSLEEKILIKNRQFLNITSNIEHFIKPIKSNLKLKLSASETRYNNMVNNSNLREIRNFGLDYGFELRSGFKGFFNYHMGTNWNFIQVKSSVENSYRNNLSFLDLSLIFNKKINLHMQTERYYFGNLNSANNTYYFLDFETRYVVKENKFILYLSGNNLFNTNAFINYTISDVYISKTEYRLLPRYMLLKMEYRF